jgi:ketosteroid isomerase-like protein
LADGQEPKQKIMKITNLFGKVLFACVILSAQAGFAQPSASPNEKAVRAYYNAFMTKDWNLIQGVLADGFTFSSPIDDHISVSTFKERCWPNCNNIKKFEITNIVVKGDDAFVISNGWTNAGKKFRNSDYFKLKDGKIVSYECFFGPGINYPNSGK